MDTTAATQRVTVLLIEQSGDPTPWLKAQEASNPRSPVLGGCSDLIAVSQLDSEVPAEFAMRASARLSRIDARTRVDRAVLVCGTRTDDGSLLLRARMAQVLLRAMDCASSAQLTLAGPGPTSDGLRLQLLAIAGTLLEESQSPNLAVWVKFGGAPSRDRVIFSPSRFSARVA